ncbi:MAG: co-chaperone GroES [Phycisphaeraceae bacterium]|nr:co-chaperone GroES [Phycisphaeraceae bacterium]
MAATKTPTKTKKKLNIRPLHDKIIVRRDEAESVTASGIFLPESSKDRPKTGLVEAVGDGALNTETGERVPLELKRGDRVIFSSYSGTEVKIDGEELLIMTESDVLAVLEG